MREGLTRPQRPFGELVVGEVVDKRRLAAAPRAHEEHERLGEDLRISEVSVAQVAILVQNL